MEHGELEEVFDTVLPKEVCWGYRCQMSVCMGTWGYVHKGLHGRTQAIYNVTYVYLPSFICNLIHHHVKNGFSDR